VGIGREVADAYIDVHGDLSSFRRDLQGADAEMRKAAFENADNFSEAWGKRVEQDVHGKWASVLDAMYSDKQVDWDRMFGQFDARGLREARDQVKEFLNVMRQTEQWGKDEEGEPVFEGMKLDIEEAAKMLSRMDEVIAGMRKRDARDAKREAEREDHARRLIDLQQDLTKAQDQYNRVMKLRAEDEAEAYEQMKAWARTFEGISKNTAIKDLNEDFTKLSKAVTDSDIGKWGNRLEGDFHRMAQRVREVSAAMLEQRRISDEDALSMVNRVDAFIKAENEKSKAMRDTLDETNRLKEAQDNYNKSLRGMAQAFHTADMETKFRQLATAIESNDWSGMARGAKNMEELRDRTMETATEMHRLGRMTDQELTMVGDRFERVTRNARKFNVEFKEARDNGTSFGTTMRNVLTRTSNLFTRLGNITRGFREHLGGFAGLNVFGDMLSKGLDFIHNLDRIAVSLGKNTILMGTMGAVGVSALASLFPIAQDLLSTLGGLAVVLPAFAVGFGIGIGVLVAAMKDMEEVLADLKPAFAELQNQISSSFWTEAAGPIREMVATLMPILTPKLKGTAAALGGLVGKLAKAFRDIPADALNTMFDRMNSAIDILGNAMPPLVRAFTTLGIIGSKYFERFSTWLVKLTDQFDAFIQRSADNGDLDRWINDMIEGFKNIGRAIDGTMGIFNAINSAAKRAGFGGLKTFADSLQRAADIMNTPAFQTTLTIYFDGARDLAAKLGQAIYDLGPAFERFAPTANIALNNVGDTVKRLIGYVGEIFSNPTFQKGVEDFTRSLATAVDKLQPAIKPFGDSLGQALSLLGQIAVSVAEVATAFVVTLSPVLDSMSSKLQTLIEPLKNTVINFIQEMEGPLKALDEQFVGPLVTAFNEKLLPAINGFIDEFGPFATKVIEDIGPSFKILVDDVLPNFVKFATELLGPLGKIVELLSPTLATTLTNIANALSGLTEAVKFLKGELPIEDLSIFKSKTEAEIQAEIEAELKPQTWGQIIAEILTGSIQRGIAQAAEKVWTEGIQPWLAGIWGNTVDAWNNAWSGEGLHGTEQGRKQGEDFMRGFQGFWTDLFSGNTPLQQIQRDFGTWFKSMDWGQVMEDFWSGLWRAMIQSFTGVPPDLFGKVLPELERQWTELWDGTADRRWTDQLIAWFPDQADFLNGVQGWTDDVFSGKWFGEAATNISKMWEDTWKEGGTVDQIDANVNDWLKTHVGDPFNGAMDSFGKSIPESFKNDVQEWGLIPAIGNHFNNVVFPAIRKAFEDAWRPIEDGSMFKDMQTESGKRWDGFWKEWNNFWGGFGSMASDIEKWFEDWWNKNVHDPFNKAVTDAWKHLFEGDDDGGGGGDGAVQEAADGFWKRVGEILFTPIDFDGINTNVNKWLDDNVWKPIGEFFSGGDEHTQEVANAFWKKVGEILFTPIDFDGINTNVNEWLNTNVWTPIGDWIRDTDWGQLAEDLWSGFIDALSANTGVNWKKAAEGFTGWREDMKNIDWGQIAEDLWLGFISAVTNVPPENVKKIVDGFTGWLGGVLEFFGIHSPSTKMMEVAGDIVQGFLNGFGDFATKVGEKWEEIKTAVTTKFEEIKTALAEKWEEFKTGWGEFWGGLGTTIGEKWEEFKTTVGQKWEELKSGLEGKWTEFKTGWDGFWGGVGTTLGTKWEEFKTTVGGKAGEIKTGVDKWAGEVKTGWDGFWGGVGTTLSDKWGEFTKTTSDKAGEIKGNVDTFGRDVKTNWDNFWGGVGKTLTDKWGEFTGTTDKKTGEIEGDVNDMAKDVKGNWQGMLSQMNDQINASFQNFVNTVSGKVGEIINWVAGMPGRIVGALGNLWNMLWSAGSFIMGGFLSGLQSQWGGITSFVGSIADWIATHKGPLDYDAKLLVPAGVAIMSGLDRGLRSQMDPLLNTLQTITAAVTDTVTADLSKSVMYMTGKDAAQGLADGLKANRTSVHTALGNLGAFTLPSSNITVGGSFDSVGRPTIDAAPGRSVTIAEGAIKIETPTRNPELVAAKVIDSFVHYSTI
jgi:phage-related protein